MRTRRTQMQLFQQGDDLPLFAGTPTSVDQTVEDKEPAMPVNESADPRQLELEEAS